MSANAAHPAYKAAVSVTVTPEPIRRASIAPVFARPRITAWIGPLVAWLARPRVSYGLLVLLQVKVLWGDWHLRDLTSGDTLFYFRYASRWATEGTVDLLWSPLYGVYYGTVLLATGDPVAATWLHRALMVVAGALLVLAVLRSLLPATMAWLLAAWWALLEPVFNARVEVHLFAVLPLLVAIVLAVRVRGIWGGAVAGDGDAVGSRRAGA